MPEDFVTVRSFGEFRGEVLTSKMQALVQAGAPFGAVGYVINEAMQSDPHAGATFAGVAHELQGGNKTVWDVHGGDYTDSRSTI